MCCCVFLFDARLCLSASFPPPSPFLYLWDPLRRSVDIMGIATLSSVLLPCSPPSIRRAGRFAGIRALSRLMPANARHVLPFPAPVTRSCCSCVWGFTSAHTPIEIVAHTLVSCACFSLPSPGARTRCAFTTAIANLTYPRNMLRDKQLLSSALYVLTCTITR